MTTATQSGIQIPAGTYEVDPIHSTATFAVEHAGVSLFRGGFRPLGARLVAENAGLVLEGRVSVQSIDIADENIRPHLLSPDFFDAERNPEISFRSTEISGSAEGLRVAGELSMAGFSLPVEARGTLRGPVPGPGGGEKVSLSLETAIDRTAYGMNWQMEIPNGGVALANQVSLTVELEFDRS
jgi:polyisoprenoid-binding protein YceI